MLTIATNMQNTMNFSENFLSFIDLYNPTIGPINITLDFIRILPPERPWDWRGLGDPNYAKTRRDASNLIKRNWKRYIRRIKAAEIIHRYMKSWLYEPTTKDGKIGINLRISMKKFYNLEYAPMLLNEIQ